MTQTAAERAHLMVQLWISYLESMQSLRYTVPKINKMFVHLFY